MDSQTINPVTGSGSGSQAQPYVAPAPTGKSTQKTSEPVATKDAAKDVKVAKPVDIEVRTRDPRSLQYQVDGSTNQVVATVVDDSNKLVVVQIPNEEVLRIAKAIDRMKGFLLEGKA